MKFKTFLVNLVILVLLFNLSFWVQAQVPEFSRTVTNPGDDAGNLPFNCDFAVNNNEIYFGTCSNGSGIISGFRFENIEVSVPEEIAEAHLEFWVDGPYDNTISIRFYGEASDSAVSFSPDSTTADRALTGSFIDWVLDSTNTWVWNTIRRSPDITPILREIIGRPGWQSGNPISIIVKNVSSDLNHRRVYAFERLGDGTKTAKLVVNSQIPEMDMSIAYIARLPRIDYVWNSSNPAVEGWPAAGDTVVWRAVVKNRMNTDLENVKCTWYLDDQLIAVDSINLKMSDTTGVDMRRPWSFERHRLRFVIDSDNLFTETEEQNNRLEIFTDAISAGFYVEQSVYDYFYQYQRLLNVGSNGWEDWAQRQVSLWNDMFADAVYPDSPDGVLDRIRIDNITVVEDGALPLAGGLPTNNPNLNDRSVDLQWGFPATLLNGGFYSNHTDTTMENPFYFEGSLLHELGHARYLIDVYGFNVHDDGSGNTMGIEENGVPILGTDYMPFIIWDVLHYTPFEGLMAGGYTFIDEYSTMALNLIAGHRATRGNYNAPENIGVFLQDLPLENRLTLRDTEGNLLTQADVKIYRAEPQEGVWYGKYFDNIADMELTSDDSGAVLLGRCPFSADGIIEHTYDIANGVIVVRVAENNRVGFAFLEASFFNMEYWRGNIALGNYELEVNMIGANTIDEPVEKPSVFALQQNFPNPFNPVTQIRFAIPKQSKAQLTVYDINGRIISTLLNKALNAGNYSVTFDGGSLSSGLYYYELRTGDFREIRKMVLVK